MSPLKPGYLTILLSWFYNIHVLDKFRVQRWEKSHQLGVSKSLYMRHNLEGRGSFCHVTGRKDRNNKNGLLDD